MSKSEIVDLDTLELNEEEVFNCEVKSDNISSEFFVENTVIDKYSVSEFATVYILNSSITGDTYYYVDQPSLDEYEKLAMKKVSERLEKKLKYKNSSEYDYEKMESIIEKEAREIINNFLLPGSKTVQKVTDKLPGINKKGITTLSERAIEKILYYIINDFVYYGKITPLMEDEYIEDISCDSPNMPIFIYHSEYRDLMTNISYSPGALNSFIRMLAQISDNHISKAEPMVDGSLPDGSRIQLTLGEEVTGDGSNFTIRKFEEIPFTPVDLIKYNTFSIEQMTYLWLAIENNKSLIFAGGTASGKTTSMNAVSLFIPPGSKTITIEDTREITLRHNNWIKSVTRDSFGGTGEGEVSMYDLLKAALRQRPEYLIVGEIRGEEALALFQAMSTGHTTYSTMHADSVETAIHRLENPPINVPRTMLKSLDILCIQEQTFVNENRVRRNNSITEILGVDSTTLNMNTQDIYKREPKTDSFNKETSSKILEEIKTQRAWSEEELNQQLRRRKEILQYLLEKDITDYYIVTDIIRSFMIEQEPILELVRNDEEEKLKESSEKIRLENLEENYE